MSAGSERAAGQRAFASAVLDPGAPPPSDLALVNGAPPSKRFAVYRNNVMASLIDALAGAFPIALRLVGEPFFRAAAAEFARAHPPRSPIMTAYGADFPAWIAAFPPAASVPYLGDVAALEWAMRESYHAADAEALSGAAFRARTSGLSDEALSALSLQAHPAARVVASRYPIFRIWSETRGQDQGDAPRSDHGEVLVSRPGDDVLVTPIPPGGAAFLGALADGASLQSAGIAAQGAIGVENAAQFDMEATLRTFLWAGAFRD